MVSSDIGEIVCFSCWPSGAAFQRLPVALSDNHPLGRISSAWVFISCSLSLDNMSTGYDGMTCTKKEDPPIKLICELQIAPRTTKQRGATHGGDENEHLLVK